MLQVAVIREQTQKVLDGLAKRNFKDREDAVRQVMENDQLRRDAQKTLDEIKAKSNNDAKKIGELMKSGKSEEAASLRASVAADKDRVKSLETELEAYEKKQLELLYKLPNVPSEKVPVGKSPEDNITVHQRGTIPTLSGEALPHWELIKKYDIIDFDLGIKISGAGFPVYKGKGAKRQRALINFFLGEAEKQGYKEVHPPIVINEASGYGTGQLPGNEGQMYF